VYLLENKVYKQNNYQDGSNAYSENTHGNVLRPLICYGRELVSFRSPTVTLPETAAVATPDPLVRERFQAIQLEFINPCSDSKHFSCQA
jgi:hypothetical protein